MFRNAQGRFDGRIFMGVMMGLGTALGMAIKLWASVADAVPPFWLWAAPVALIVAGVWVWLVNRRQHGDLRGRIERASLASARRKPEAEARDDINKMD